jgi:putative ABC transport system permease protein
MIASTRMSVFLAGRSLARSNYGVAAMTTIMMLLIYISLLFLPSLIQGAINRADTQLTSTLTSNIVITPAGHGTSIDDAASYLASIRGTAGVAAATAVYRVGTQVSYGATSVNATIDAIDPASYGQVFSTPRNLIEGRALTTDDTTQVLLGIGVAGANHPSVRGYRASLETVNAGDTVSVTLTSGHAINLTVAGVYDNQFPQSDGNAYITRSEAASLVPPSVDHATTIYVKTRPGTTETREVSRLEKIRGGMQFLTSADLGAAVQDQTATYQLISTLLKLISLAMAAATIITITYIDLVSKRRQTGIQRAIGIRSAPIVASYVLKAWAYALAGIGAGYLLLRYVITPLVNAHPFQFPNGPVTLATTWHEIILDLIVLAIVATLAALLPAWRAIQTHILDAIWGT